MNDTEQIEKMSSALGKLAPKGTWISEILENIWYAKTKKEADDFAMYARQVFREIGIEDGLWVGDRESDFEIVND